ncbi:hypothetical protein UlMin_022177 [Ulmus minor]
MEIEPSPSMVAKKLWHIVRVVFMMMRKGLSKSKIMVEFHLLLKRGKLAGKAMANNFFLQHYSALTCRSNDANLNFVSPKEYEFSCSNSPANPFHYFNKRKHHHYHKSSYQYDDVTTVSAVQKVLEMLNSEIVEASPLVSLPGFGKSPMVRQLRITDSPFPVKYEGDKEVDVKADDFIKNFYKKLKLQKNLESPYRAFG